jgi:hypothetical protein
MVSEGRVPRRRAWDPDTRLNRRLNLKAFQPRKRTEVTSGMAIRLLNL